MVDVSFIGRGSLFSPSLYKEGSERNQNMSTTKKEKLSHWESAKVDDIIQLKDEQTIGFLMEEGHENLTHGADFTIKRIRKIEAQEGKAEWLILNMEFADFQWYFIAKSNGADFDMFIYYVPDGFEDGDRQDITDKADWLMEVWEDGTELKDVSFAKEIQQGEATLFKTDGAVYGMCREDGDKSFASVVEYSTDDPEEENPLMLAIEFNELEAWSEREESVEEDEDGDVEVEVTVESGVNINEDSSYIMLLQGCRVSIGDVDLMKV